MAAYVRTRTVDEVIDMAKHGLAAGKGAQRQDTFTVLKKHAANTTINSDATARDEVFTDVQVNLGGAWRLSTLLPLPCACDGKAHELGSTSVVAAPATTHAER